MTAFFNPWVLLTLVLAIAGAAGGGYYKGNSAGKAEVQAEWAKEKAEQYAEYAKGQEAARAREQEMDIEMVKRQLHDDLKKDKVDKTWAEVNRNAEVFGLGKAMILIPCRFAKGTELL